MARESIGKERYQPRACLDLQLNEGLGEAATQITSAVDAYCEKKVEDGIQKSLTCCVDPAGANAIDANTALQSQGVDSYTVD